MTATRNVAPLRELRAAFTAAESDLWRAREVESKAESALAVAREATKTAWTRYDAAKGALDRAVRTRKALTKAQTEVIAAFKRGYRIEVYKSMLYSSRRWISPEDRRLPASEVSAPSQATLTSLVRRGLLRAERTDDPWRTIYRLAKPIETGEVGGEDD